MSTSSKAPGNAREKNGHEPPPRIPPSNTPRDTCPDPASACGCCAGTEPITPQSIANRPGLSALAYRIGTHATFLETMKARLSSHCLGDAEASAKGGGMRPLAGLRTRDDGDPSIALLDAWASVGDVLTFYQERIANEGYLRTATERRSVQELAQLVGYSPRPGVAASTYLAYTIDDNTKEEVLIPAGSRAQSVPGPDELPQSFETSEDIKARAAWNTLVPRKTLPQQWGLDVPLADKSKSNVITPQGGELYLKGISTRLQPNDPLLVVCKATGQPASSDVPHLFRVTTVDADGAAGRTKVAIEPWVRTDAVTMACAAVRAAAAQFAESARSVKAPGKVVENLVALRDVAARAAGDEELVSFLTQQTFPLLESVAGPARRPPQKLTTWLAEARTALAGARDALLSANAVVEPPATQTKTLFSEGLNTLLKKPSRPLANALNLRRDLKAGFRSTSDAGLKALGLVSPDLRESLGAAIESYTKTSPEAEFEVHALRLKAGVFGRNAPKRTKTVRVPANGDRSNETTEIMVIGEWPIIADSLNKLGANTELFNKVSLDGDYGGILPGSWVVLDSSAVDTTQAPMSVLPTATLFITRAQKITSKVARAEYGMTGDSVCIDLNTNWLGLKDPPPDRTTRQDSVIMVSVAPDDGGQHQLIYNNDFQVIRNTAVYAQSEKLELAEAPIAAPVCDGAGKDAPLELDGLYRELEPGRFVIVSGERADIADTTGVFASEAAMITEVVHDVRRADKAVPHRAEQTVAPNSSVEQTPEPPALPGDRTHTFIRLDKSLSYCYRRESLTIYGNVVKATHGETRNETLGGGDGAKALQAFTLKQSPLTYLAAPTAVGAETTLQVFVDNVRWREKSSFIDATATDRIYLTRTDDNGNTTAHFGNGREGARLPTGIENVKALYRSGIGKVGNVRARQISLLATRPLGVKEVINPLRASGGADRETRDQARRNAPLAVMALDRLVSTRDYADFARSFAGIAKADAVELSDGRRTVVHVTIAGSDDIPIDTGSDLYRNLRRALNDLGDPFQPVQLASHELLMLVLSACLRIDPDHRWERVVTDVRTKLLETFGFERRELAQDATASEVLSTIQSVRGVVYVDLDAFGAVPSTSADPNAEGKRRPSTPEETAREVERITKEELAPRVLAAPARVEATGIAPAQLAVLVPELPATVVLNQIKD